MLGDASSMTDNLVFEEGLPADDRWVFTEENPRRELHVISGLAAASRVLKSENPELAKESLAAAEALYALIPADEKLASSRAIALSELILTTGKDPYKKEMLELQSVIVDQIDRCGWAVGRVVPQLGNKKFEKALEKAVTEYYAKLLEQQKNDSPYGVPYKPNIWGAGWSIQRFGVEQYFFYKSWPEICTRDFTLNSLNFVLGVHPGENTASFASGVGSSSVTAAYGVNRADWSFIPGGVASGTALIRPDLPELKVWPFFWQQTEYVMGGGSTNYMFLVLAAQNILK